MGIYKIIFTISQSLFIVLALIAVFTDKRKDQRDCMFKIILWYVMISSVGCIVGMWM